MKIFQWIQLRCSPAVLRFFPLMNISQLLLRILKLAGHEAGRIVNCPKLLLSAILILLLIRHFHLDNRTLQFLQYLQNHLNLRREFFRRTD